MTYKHILLSKTSGDNAGPHTHTLRGTHTHTGTHAHARTHVHMHPHTHTHTQDHYSHVSHMKACQRVSDIR